MDKCLQCCQTYKTLEKRTHRYEGAVILHANLPNLFPEIDSFLEEDLEKIQKQKGKNRLKVVQVGGGGGMMFQQPSVILWFDESLPSNQDSDIYELQRKSKESIMLDGWKRDDVRDMLLALLPDA